MNSKKNLYVILLLTLALLSGCAKPPPPLPTATPQPLPILPLPVGTQADGAPAPADAATAIPVGDLYRPIDPAECQVIHDNAVAALNTRMGITEKSLDEFAAFGVRGGACMIRAKGTGAQFDLVNTLAKIEAAVNAGWTPADKYRMDSEISVARGYTKGNATLIIGISWDPVPEANCPLPFTSCQLTPEQKIFKIVLIAMQK